MGNYNNMVNMTKLEEGGLEIHQSTQVLSSLQHLLATITTVNRPTQMIDMHAVLCMVPINSGTVSSVLMKAPAAQDLHGLRGLVSNYRATHQKII